MHCFFLWIFISPKECCQFQLNKVLLIHYNIFFIEIPSERYRKFFLRNFKGRKLLSPKRRQSTTWRSKAWRKCSNIYFMPLLSSTPKERSHSTRPKLLSRSWAMDIAGGGRLMKTYRTGNESCIQNRMFSTAMETNGLLLESLNVGCSAILYWDNGTGQSHPTLPVSCPVLNRSTKV